MHLTCILHRGSQIERFQSSMQECKHSVLHPNKRQPIETVGKAFLNCTAQNFHDFFLPVGAISILNLTTMAHMQTKFFKSTTCSFFRVIFPWYRPGIMAVCRNGDTASNLSNCPLTSTNVSQHVLSSHTF